MLGRWENWGDELDKISSRESSLFVSLGEGTFRFQVRIVEGEHGRERGMHFAEMSSSAR